jgi:hypothetical protein
VVIAIVIIATIAKIINTINHFGISVPRSVRRSVLVSADIMPFDGTIRLAAVSKLSSSVWILIENLVRLRFFSPSLILNCESWLQHVNYVTSRSTMTKATPIADTAPSRKGFTKSVLRKNCSPESSPTGG